MNRAPGNDCPPAVVAAEGPSTAVGANASAIYPASRAAGKGAVSALAVRERSYTAGTALRSLAGCVSRYRGKRARVLAMLASRVDGVTQLDTLPWHTRLCGTIHALRSDGLAIETEREGEYRHARYRLRALGTLVLAVKS